MTRHPMLARAAGKARIKVAPKSERTMDGVVFASKAEMRRYAMLKLSQRAGLIRDLEIQPRLPIVIGGVKVCTYVGDFRYVELQNGKPLGSVIEDCKGHKTEMYLLKKKLVRAVHGIEIREVKA